MSKQIRIDQNKNRTLDPRKFTLSTRVSAEEKEMIDVKLLKAGISPATAIRLMLLHENLPNTVEAGVNITAREAYINLQPLQSNLNQIAHQLNTNPGSIEIQIIQKLVPLLKQIESEVKQLRSEVLGAS